MKKKLTIYETLATGYTGLLVILKCPNLSRKTKQYSHQLKVGSIHSFETKITNTTLIKIINSSITYSYFVKEKTIAAILQNVHKSIK